MRTKRQIQKTGRYSVIEEVTESFTHRCVVQDCVMFGDPANNFWRADGGSWYGVPPAQWNDEKAERLAIPLAYSYQYEADYS